MVLPERADIDIAVQCPVFRRSELAVERNERSLALRGLRPGVNRGPITLEQLDRRRADNTKEIRRARNDEMDLVLLTPADIGIDACKPRRRLLTPSTVVEALRRDINCDVALLPPELQTRVQAAIRSALDFGLQAVKCE